MRLAAFITGCVLITVAWSFPAQATSQKNMERLSSYFKEQGEIVYELHAPLGGPELGGAVIKSGDASFELRVASVDGKKINTLVTERLPKSYDRPPFTFMLTGNHLLTYITQDWTGPDGRKHFKGDIKVTALIGDECPKVVYELKDVVDMQFQVGDVTSASTLLWQPSTHFLNSSGKLPVKYNYFELSMDTENGEYEIHQHLTPLPDAAMVDAANMNNRAIVYYRMGRLEQASALLEQAALVAEADQSIILRNQFLINTEITELGYQGKALPDRPFDEALQYFWQGNYTAVLRVMDARRALGLNELDLTILGIALAEKNRWNEVDQITTDLEKRKAPWLADYLWHLTNIAFIQKHEDVTTAYLTAVEVVDKNHPGYIQGIARLMQMTGHEMEALDMLEKYVNYSHPAGANLSGPMQDLYAIYHKRGLMEQCNRLEELAGRGPIVDLLNFVILNDYTDLSTSLVDVETERDRLKAPSKPLETFGMQ